MTSVGQQVTLLARDHMAGSKELFQIIIQKRTSWNKRYSEHFSNKQNSFLSKNKVTNVHVGPVKCAQVMSISLVFMWSITNVRSTDMCQCTVLPDIG